MFGFGKSKAEKRAALERIIPELQWFDLIAVNRFRWYNPLTWTSRVTRVLTASKYSHVLVSGADGVGWSTGVTGFPDYRYGSLNLIDYLMGQDNILIQRVPLTEQQIEVGKRLVFQQVGQKYPKIDLLSMVGQNLADPGERRLFFDAPVWFAPP